MANKYQYKFTELAEKDLESALEYISDQLCNAKAASELLSKTDKTIENICLFPYSYPDCTYYLIGDESIRHAIVDNYVLIYEVKDEEKQINILRFRYTRMNLAKLVIKDESK